MLVYPAGMSVSTRALRFVTDALRAHRETTRTRWRVLSSGGQALMVLAHLRKGETYRDLAVGFGVGTTTAYRYLREALQVLASLAPTLEQATQVAAREYVILDGPRPRARQPGLKNWRILRKIRSSPAHARILVDAIQTLIINAEAV